MIRTNRLGLANEAKMTRERFIESMEAPVYNDVVHDDRSARPQFRPSPIHLEAHVALAMQAVVDEEIDRFQLREEFWQCSST